MLLFLKTPADNGLLTLAISIVFMLVGLYFLLKPEEVRSRYLQNFNWETKLKWYDPSTYLREPPPLLLFRIIGLVSVLVGGFGLCVIILRGFPNS